MTKGVSRTLSATERTRRFAAGASVRPTAMMTFRTLAPTAATTARASTRVGKAMSPSMTRWSIRSVRPPR